MDRFQYLGLLIGCLACTIPLEFIYRFKVWRDPLRLLKAVGPGFVLFSLWDLFAIGRRHWDFNPRYISGWTFPGGIPIEELLFFVVIPIASISGYEAVRHDLARRRERKTGSAGA